MRLHLVKKNLKKAIKYVSEYNRNNSVERRNYRNIEKSASPLGLNQRFKYNEFNQSTTPIRRVLNLTRDLKYNTNINKSKDYEIEISSINENGMPKSKSKEKEKKEEKNNLRENNDDDINELITTIEDLQSIINGQKYEIKNLKKENKRKDKEIEYLTKEISTLKNELDEKEVAQEKNIEDIFQNNDVIKLKKEYFKLLQDYGF